MKRRVENDEEGGRATEDDNRDRGPRRKVETAEQEACDIGVHHGSTKEDTDPSSRKLPTLVPAHEQIAKLLEMCSMRCAKPDVEKPLLRRSASLSGDIEDAARSLLPENTPALYPRVWTGDREEPTEGVQLKFMQFNVLADGLSGEDPGKGGFGAVPPQSLDWQFRRINLVREIFRQGVWPDIISMQEVDHYYDWFEPLLSQLGYAGHYIKKPNSPCKTTAPHSGLEDGCALFWRTDTVVMTAIETMNFNVYNKDGTRTGEKYNQVAILATLQVEGASPFVAAVTHLLAAKTAEGEHVRSQQMNELIERLETFQLPCVVGLDMNAEPPHVPGAKYDAEAYPLAVSKEMTIYGKKKPLSSAYAVAMGAEPRWTTWKRRQGHDKNGEVSHTIDYVLISDDIGCTRVLMPPADEDIVAARLPGWEYPSDHVALLAQLTLPPGKKELENIQEAP